jgi:hypothetical protein
VEQPNRNQLQPRRRIFPRNHTNLQDPSPPHQRRLPPSPCPRKRPFHRPIFLAVAFHLEIRIGINDGIPRITMNPTFVSVPKSENGFKPKSIQIASNGYPTPTPLEKSRVDAGDIRMRRKMSLRKFTDKWVSGDTWLVS